MVNEHYAYHSNGNTHLHSVSTSNGHTPEATLVQIDSEPIANGTVLANTTMGQPAVDNQRSFFRKFPMRSILKNGKVHNSPNENVLDTSNGRTGILKKPIQPIVVGPKQDLKPKTNGSPAMVNSLPVSESTKAVNQVSAKSAASTVQFRIDSATAASNAKSSDTPAMSSNGAFANTGAASSSSRPSIASAVSNLQTLSVNHLQVPPQPHSAVIRPSAAFFSASSSSHQLALPPTTATSSRPQSSNQSNMQPSYYTGTTNQRMSDLRKILNPEVEKEDSFKKFTEAIENCDCFEFNLNNAAKLITILVLLATLVLVIRALKGDR